MLKRILAILLAALLCAGLAGCSALKAAVSGTISDLGDSLLSQANSSSASDETASGSVEQETILADAKSAEESVSDEARYTVEGIRPVAEALVEGGFEVCAIFFNGTQCAETPVSDDEGNPTSWYPVTDARFTTIEDMKAFAELYYTPAFASAALYSTAFDCEYPKYQTRGETLCSNQDVGGLGWGIEWLFDTMTITAQTENSVTLEMETMLFDEEDGVKSLLLTKADGEWRLDSSVRG